MTLQGNSKIQRDNVLVAVRVRSHENYDSIIDISGTSLVLNPPKSGYAGTKSHQFGFDKCYANPGDNRGSQEAIFNDFGEIALHNAFSGYNVTILAYGQTGSGKSYCMMGPASDPGLIPRISKELFNRIKQQSATVEGLKYTCEASYFEIYNEKVRDLLDPKKMEMVGPAGLTVREHPKHGPYVEDLSNIPVQSYDDIARLLNQGNAGRTVAATRMNSESSRSHAIFTLKLKQTVKNLSEGVICEKVAHIHLVDLAGSERQAKTKAQGTNFKEAAEINKSLVTLGRVISALAESSFGKKNGTPSRSSSHIPFRDSTLTWLLKRSFGINGNSRTMLICTVSSKAADYEESLGSLRYAARAKKIVTSAICNEDSNNKLVEGLKNEIKELTEKLGSAEKTTSQEIYQLSEQLQNAQKLIQVMNMSWEDKLKQAEQIRADRENALQREGIAIKLDPFSSFLYSVNGDSETGDCLVYYLKKGDTNIGRSSSLSQPCILLHLEEGPELFCIIKTMNDCTSILIPHDGISQIFVNGQRVTQDLVLSHGDRVVFGGRLTFRYSASMNYLQKSPSHSRAEINWDFAHKELQARLDSITSDLEKERDQVKILEQGATETDTKYHHLVKELEIERAKKAELSVKLKLAIEETVKTRRLLEVSELGFDSISKTQQRKMLKMQEELKKEKSLRGNLSMLVERIRNDSSLDLQQNIHYPFGNTPVYQRYLIEAIIKSWRASTLRLCTETLRSLCNRVYCCNAMAIALGHEVLFELASNVKLASRSPIPLLEAFPIVRMKSVAVPVVCFSVDVFSCFYKKLREFYCYTLERQDNRKDHLHLDPIEHLKANPLQISDFVWGIGFNISSIISSGNEVSSLSLFDGLGNRAGYLFMKIRTVDSSAQDSVEIMFESLGIKFLQNDLALAHPISVAILLLSTNPDKTRILEFDDVPVVHDSSRELNDERILKTFVIDDLKSGILERTFQIAVNLGPLNPENLSSDTEIWSNARRRHQSLKRVSVLKTPSICSDGSIRLPGPSPRLISARTVDSRDVISSMQNMSISKNRSSTSDFTPMFSANSSETNSSTRVHVSIEIQELIPSSGTYSNCLTKRCEDNATVFKISASRPKRFQIRILQADTNHLSLESCSSLKVVAIRSEGLRDLTVFECDLTQVQIHIHDRYLIFRCPWPSELSNHSYSQRNAVFEMDLEITIYVDWQPEPIAFRHTVFCKASRTGLFKRLLNNISTSTKHSGFFNTFHSVTDPKFFLNFKETSRRIQHGLRSKIRLEKCRVSHDLVSSDSPSDKFFKATLDVLHYYGGGSPLRETQLLPSMQVSVTHCSEMESQPERSGFLHQSQRRYFCVLRYPFLQLFRHPSRKIEDESIDLTGGSFFVDENSQQPFTFKLQCKSKTYSMQASCEEDLLQWVNCFSLYLNVSK